MAKYRANAQDPFKTLKIKALDSMPVGTQVEYTGTDIPVGWEQVNDYSTTEINTGKKWIDGKPIYRKVVSIQSLGNNERIQVAHNISNIKQVIDSTLTYYDSVDGGWYNTRFNGNNIQVTVNIYYVTSTNVIINCYGEDWRSRTNNIYAILEYTKTTD